MYVSEFFINEATVFRVTIFINKGLCQIAVFRRIPAMIVYDVAKKLIDTELFPEHNIADLNSDIFVQSREAFTVKGNTHTHTHTHARARARAHTHTHTHTHTHYFKN